MTEKNITILDNFLNEKEFKILKNNLDKINFVATNNGPYKYGFGHNFNPDETNKWLFNKIKDKFFPDKDLKPTDCSFRLRHNVTEVLPHKDDHVNYLFLYYLKGKETTYNGTGFYNDDSTLDRYIGFKENRALFFDSHIVHTDLQALGESSPRYSLNIFYE
jgi:hypothetical protein|tara:strand:- start:58 stop:540 length:483 start_codon:yes stop_codon:yes gene_type:complete